MNEDRGINKNQNQDSSEENQNPSYEQGSKSDPQMTELEGLKEGGKEPHVHREDKPQNSDGETSA